MALDTGNNLVSLNDVKSYLGYSISQTTYDDRFNDLINSVSWQFNLETGRKLKARSHTEYYDGDGSDELQLNEWPCNSASTAITLYVDSNRGYTTDKLIDSTNIIVYSTVGIIKLDDDSFDDGEQSVKITYNGGYSTIPYDLQYAAKEMVRFLWNREQRNEMNVRSESMEGGSVSYELNMPWSVRRVLDMYRRRNLE